jgi:dTDP-4-dehydrorhamnose reductase
MSKREITVKLDRNSIADAMEEAAWRVLFWRSIRFFLAMAGVVLLGVVLYSTGALDDGSKVNNWVEKHDAAKKEAIYGNSKTVEEQNVDQQNEMLCRNGSPYCVRK